VSMEWITRRHATRLLVLGAASATLGKATKYPLWASDAAQGAPGAIPAGAIIRTILEDIPPEPLGTGAVLLHEHLSYLGKTRTTEKDDVKQLVELLAGAERAGVSCIADAGADDTGRDMEALREAARQSRVHIVASGGYYMEHTYPAELATQSEDQIVDTLVQQANANRYGAFGEIGESPDQPLDALERKVFRAVGKAHVKTGLPIRTHTAYGTGPHVPNDAGLVQLDVLESVGVAPEHVLIGHVCCDDDPKVEAARAIAKRGAFVGFDRVTFVKYVPDDMKVRMILAMLDAGYGNKLILSSDFVSQIKGSRMWEPSIEQGVGYERTLTVFAPMLRKAGVSDGVIKDITSNNPRRLIAFVPKHS
jgi:phosphotriesterase-related protein